MNFFLLWNIIFYIFVHKVEIKGNQNGLVTFYKIFFCVQQKKVVWKDMRVRKWWQNLLAVLSSSLAQNQCFTVKCFSMWQKCIIKFVALVVNSVISISIRFCPDLCIHLSFFQLKALWPIKTFKGKFVSRMVSICLGPNFNPSPAPTPERFLHFTIATHPPPPKKNVILRGPHRKFCAQGPEFLAKALITCTSIFADQLRTVSEIQLTQYRVALGKWILQSNMKRDYLPWWPSSHVKIERGRLILATPRSLQWANKEWKDENWRFILKCKLQGLSWLKIGLMILQPQHAQDYITLLPNHW